MRSSGGSERLEPIAAELASRIEDEANARSEYDRVFKREIFVELMVEDLAAAVGYRDPQLAFHSHSKGNAPIAIDGATVSEDEETLYLFIAEFSGAPTIGKLDRQVAARAAARAVRFLRFALDNHDGIAMTEDAKVLRSFILDSWDRIEAVRVVVITDAVYDARPLAPPTAILGREIGAEVFDLRRLSRILAPEASQIVVDFDERMDRPLRQVSREVPDEDYDCDLLILPGQLLADLYEENGVALLELNVRAFLGSTNKVNAGIRRTLKNYPSRFLAFNNGISATARDIVMAADGKSIARISGLQVVNGGQTLAALHHAAYVDKSDLSKVEVATKLTRIKKADHASFVGEISSYANTQSIVQLADFSANRPFHIELERISRRVWIPGERGQWFFERTRGQYNVAKTLEGTSPAARKRFKERFPPARRFSKTDVARYENCWAQLPHEVSSGAQYNYRAWLAEVELAEWSPDETWFKRLVAKAIIYKSIRRQIRDADFQGYWAQIAAYAMALASSEVGGDVDLLGIWNTQALPGWLEERLAGTCAKVDDAIRATSNRQNIGQWCKKRECWEAVKTSVSASDQQLAERDAV